MKVSLGKKTRLTEDDPVAWANQCCSPVHEQQGAIPHVDIHPSKSDPSSERDNLKWKEQKERL